MARLKRFALIGDVHAEDESLAGVLATIAELGDPLDAILCVGDIVDGLGDPDRCCELLIDAGAIVVRGNHERWLLRSEMRSLPGATDLAALSPESIAWLGSLPPTRELATIDGPLLLCHAVGDDDMTRLADDDHGDALESNAALTRVMARGTRIMVCGHTHQPYVRRIALQECSLAPNPNGSAPRARTVGFGAGEPIRIGDLLVINAGTLYRAHRPGFVIVDLEARFAQRFDIEVAEVRETERIALP